jgi:hypothetical protein
MRGRVQRSGNVACLGAWRGLLERAQVILTGKVFLFFSRGWQAITTIAAVMGTLVLC